MEGSRPVGLVARPSCDRLHPTAAERYVPPQYLFRNPFGFDTLTVNGCLEEARPGGFSRAARSIAIENLNNLGIRFGPGLIFEAKVIAIFFERLRAASARMRATG